MSIDGILGQLDKLNQKDLNILGCLLQTLRSRDEYFPFTTENKLYHAQNWERSDFIHYFISIKDKVDEYDKETKFDPFAHISNLKLRASDIMVECSLIMSTLALDKLDEKYLSEHNEVV